MSIDAHRPSPDTSSPGHAYAAIMALSTVPEPSDAQRRRMRDCALALLIATTGSVRERAVA